MFGLLSSSTYSSYSGYSSSASSAASANAVSGLFGAFTVVYMLIVLAIAAVEIAGMWKVFVKAGVEGWKSIIPIYNLVILYKLVGLNPWLILTCLIPCVGATVLLVINCIAYYKLALAFGKGTGFAIGLMFLSPIFMCILGFGKAEFQGVPETTK